MIIKNLFTAKNNRGLTLTELLVVMVLLSVLVYSVGFCYNTGIAIWSQNYERARIRNDLIHSFELMTRELRQAKRIDSLTESSVTFTADFGAGDRSYRFYLYSAGDPEPNPPYSDDRYQLRWAQGDVTYGKGAVLSRDILTPVQSPFFLEDRTLTVDLTASHEDQALRVRSNITPRNL